jgi:predicted MFS family arabinose efflux permease
MITGLFVIMAAILLLPWMQSVALLMATMFLLGPLHSLAFSYSFFHGVTGSIRRSQRMAIHEALLAGGIITGSTAGGMIYQRSSMVTVSLFVASVAIVVAAAQIYLSVRASKRD